MAYEDEDYTAPAGDEYSAPAGGEEEAIPQGMSAPEDTSNNIPDDPAAEESYQPEDWVRQLLDETRAQFGIGSQEQSAIPDEDQVDAEATPQQFTSTGAGEGAEEDAFKPDPNLIPDAPESQNIEDRRAEGSGGLGRGAPTAQDVPAFTNKTSPADALPQDESVPQQGLGEQGVKTPSATEQPAMVQQFMRYLFGAEADPSHEQRVHQVRANNPDLDENSARMEALRLAQKEGAGPGALQSDRAKYTTLRAAAAAAFDHGQDGDKAAALFNKSQNYVPNGQKAVAMSDGNGWTMVMPTPNRGTGGTGVGETEARSIRLSNDQVRELLHKPVGEFDHLIENGLFRNASELARSPGMPLSELGQPQAQGAPGYTPPAPASGPGLVQSSVPNMGGTQPNIAPAGQMPGPGQVTRQEFEAQQRTHAAQRGEVPYSPPVDPTGGYQATRDPRETTQQARQALQSGNVASAAQLFNQSQKDLGRGNQSVLATTNPNGGVKLTMREEGGQTRSMDLSPQQFSNLLSYRPAQVANVLANSRDLGQNTVTSNAATPPGKGANVPLETRTDKQRELTPEQYREQGDKVIAERAAQQRNQPAQPDAAQAKQREHAAVAQRMYPNDPAKQAQAEYQMRKTERDQDLRERALTTPRPHVERAPAAPRAAAEPTYRPYEGAGGDSSLRRGGGGGGRSGGGRQHRRHY